MNCEVIDNAKTAGLADEVIASIRQVYDPEIPVNVYDLGLIYKVRLDEDDRAFVTMTLTTPNCPVADSLPSQVESVVMLTEGVTDAHVELTFDPPFTIDMMSDEPDWNSVSCSSHETRISYLADILFVANFHEHCVEVLLLLCLSLFIFGVPSTEAQTATVRGFVTDASDGQALQVLTWHCVMLPGICAEI